MTFFGACGPKEDGSWMHCHAAFCEDHVRAADPVSTDQSDSASQEKVNTDTLKSIARSASGL